MRITSLAAIVILFSACAIAQGSARLRPPESFWCDRNHLTSFSGQVTQYQHRTASLVIKMETDESTKERFLVRGSRKKLETQFLIDAKPFEPGDWKRIELSSTKMQPGTRATVWVCQSPQALIVDWSPKP